MRLSRKGERLGTFVSIYGFMNCSKIKKEITIERRRNESEIFCILTRYLKPKPAPECKRGLYEKSKAREHFASDYWRMQRVKPASLFYSNIFIMNIYYIF